MKGSLGTNKPIRHVNCDSEDSFRRRQNLLFLYGETLKNDLATSASLSFIYNPHLIIIQRPGWTGRDIPRD